MIFFTVPTKVHLSGMDYNGCGLEMDLTTSRPREGSMDACKSRQAKSVFSIRSLVDLGDNSEHGGIRDSDRKCFNNICLFSTSLYIYKSVLKKKKNSITQY